MLDLDHRHLPRTTHASAFALAVVLWSFVAAAPCPAGDVVILATTTSVYDTGLIDTLRPFFERRSGLRLKPLAVGTGEALRMGRDREADVLLVHAPVAEERFMSDGHGSSRRRIMHNHFALVGPADDRADVRRAPSPAAAMQRIASAGATFISRGDNSGTHQKERELLAAAGLQAGSWTGYREAGQGMADTLRLTSQFAGYTLTDMGTFLALASSLELTVLCRHGSELLNVYSVITVTPDATGTVNATGAKAFADFLALPSTQWLIGTVGRHRLGQALFVPDLLKRHELDEHVADLKPGH